MAELESYRFVAQVHESDRVRIVRGSGTRDTSAVLLKQHRRSPGPAELAHLEQELALIQSLEVAGVVHARGLVDVHGEPTLVLDDPGGFPLDHQEVGTTPISLETKLDLAIRITAIVGDIHRSGVVHRGLQPSIILWDRASNRLTVIDFSLATRATRDVPSAAGAKALVGTPDYVSPEQTGRLGMVVDRRSDLYSLGGTLYRLFAGRPPFEGHDIAALLHAHVARVPERADRVAPDVPPILASNLEKLLRKDPDDRYQTASGLEADLRRVAAGESDFVLATDDAPSVLRVRERLVGREREIGRLEALTDDLTVGHRALAYVFGEAGIGKSALLLQLARAVVARGGIYARGKFDLSIAGTPYHPIAQILAELTGVSLALPDTALESLRDQLEVSMSALAPALVDVFPVVRPLFREVAPLVKVPALESRNRLVASFLELIATVARSQIMTVLVVDDLQWADVASLTLLEALARDASTAHVGLVVAARDDEVLPGSPVARFLASLDATGKHVERIRVAPLTREPVAAVLADSLHTTPDRVERLSHVVWKKTQGNPFFLRTLLESAIDRGFVRYESGFVWDDAVIEGSPVAEDIATLLARKLGDLPSATRDALTIAARIGAPIEVAVVATMLGVSEPELLQVLAPAIAAGLLFRADSAICFAHDRLVEASLALATDERARSIHAELSSLLLSRDDGARFFEAVDHLWLSGDAADDAERARRSSLALAAARRAGAARAFEAAERYFVRYAETMDPLGFERAFEANFDAHLEWAEAAYLAGRYERAETLFAALEARARTAVERLRVRRTLITFKERTYRFLDAIRLSFATLADVGVLLPRYDGITPDDVTAEVGRFLERFGGVEPAASLPVAESAITRDAIAMLVAVSVPLWSAQPEALPMVLARAGILSLDEGLAPASSAGLVLLGSFLCGVHGHIDAGMATAKLGLAVQERIGNADYECQTLFAYNTMVQFHFESAALGRAGLLAGFQRGIAVGNRQWASYCADQYPLRGALIGLPLPRVAEDIHEIGPAHLRLEQDDSITFAEPLVHFVERVLERPDTPWNLGARTADMATALAYLRESKHRGPILIHAMFRMLECLVGGDEEQAYAIARSEEALLFQPTGQLQSELVLVLFALAVARRAPRDDTAADAAIAGIVDRFARFSRFEETSFGGYHALVEAARLERAGSLDEAAAACDRAIDVFERDRTLHLLGLANELAARAHAAAGRARIAHFYLAAARRAYERWGAPGPVRRLDAELGAGARRPPSVLVDSHADTASALGELAPVDVVSLLKAARVIASEVEIDPLIATLLKIVAENAGANRAHLFLERGGKLVLEAFCDADLVVVRALPGEHENPSDAPFAIANLVARTREPIVFHDASVAPQVAVMPYLARRGGVAVLAAPIERHGKVAGVVVLENDLVPDAFAARQVEVVSALNAQIAVALENAALYDELRARAASLASSNERLRDEIRERERAERALGESEAALRHAQKMEAIGVLAGGIAHDFNNLLNIISVCSSMMLEGLPPANPSRTLVEDIQRAGESGATLIRQLLAFSRRQVVSPKDVSLGAIVRDLMPILKRLAARGLSFELSVDDGLDVIHADRGQLEQVLLNLVVNARDAMPNGGTIHVDVFGAAPGVERARLRVRDEGVGMDEATRWPIFEPFFTTKEVGRGTGLGLSTVYGIVAEAGGTIDVQSTPGAGATFEIAFPVVATTPLEACQAPVGVAMGTGVRVLVVDDDPTVRALAAGILGTHGYDVTTASGGTEALAIAQRFEQSEQPLDLVLTDFVMPGCNGRELAERLHAMRSSLRVLYISGYTNDAILRRLARSGDVSIVEKPFTPTALLESVTNELAR